MSLWQMAIREIAYRKTAFLVTLLGVALATGSLVAAQLLLAYHDRRTESILRQKEAQTATIMANLEVEVNRAMHRLGYNAVILPKDQPLGDWYADEYASKLMSEKQAEVLSKAAELAERLAADADGV